MSRAPLCSRPMPHREAVMSTTIKPVNQKAWC